MNSSLSIFGSKQSLDHEIYSELFQIHMDGFVRLNYRHHENFDLKIIDFVCIWN